MNTPTSATVVNNGSAVNTDDISMLQVHASTAPSCCYDELTMHTTQDNSVAYMCADVTGFPAQISSDGGCADWALSLKEHTGGNPAAATGGIASRFTYGGLHYQVPDWDRPFSCPKLCTCGMALMQ